MTKQFDDFMQEFEALCEKHSVQLSICSGGEDYEHEIRIWKKTKNDIFIADYGQEYFVDVVDMTEHF